MDILNSGQMLGAYRIINQIGQGGMATVYKAYQASMDRNVAIKVLPSHLANSKEFAGRFQQEARIIANLEHPHILPVFDSGESDGISYLVMRYLEAGTLQEKIESRPLSWNEIDRIFTQLAEALDYAHNRGVIHRDLKPSNALIDLQGNLFLTDFGIAKLLEGTSHFTKTDTVMGTPAYISPEQAQGQVVDRRSDIYSLGIILYEMVTGRVPFMADTPLAVILKHVSDPLPLPSTIKPDIPPLIEQVILKSLAKSPQDRFDTATEFIAAWKRAFNMSEATQAALANDDKTMRYTDMQKQAKPVDSNASMEKKATTKRPSRGLWVGCLVGVCLLGSVAGLALFAFNRESLPFSPGNASEEYFEIAIGDDISNGEPNDGAGFIESPGSKDIYTFTAEPGETIYVHVIAQPEDTEDINFSMRDDLDLNIFDTCLQCGDPGLITLERGGVYTITVGNEDPESTGYGEYRFKLWEAPEPEEFSISLDEEISRDTPGDGAGFIETPGAQDIYTFTAEEGQDVYFQVKEEPSTEDAIYWRVEDEDGTLIFENCLQCGDPGLITLANNGLYTMLVGGSSHGTGAYSIQAWVVSPFNEFEIQIGDTISQDDPGPGAGFIESPGTHDIYAFTATAGQIVIFSVLESPGSDNSIYWRLEDEDEDEFFDDCMGCGDPEPILFEQDGTYKIIVGSETSAGMGEYQFKIEELISTLPNWPLLENGSQGFEVYALQYLLQYHGQDIPADGDFGQVTEQAVIDFQSQNGLAENGVVEEPTWRALISDLTLENGSEGEAVLAVQYLLREKFGFTTVDIDGSYGDLTDAAVREFQAANGLTVNGIVDTLQTWQALISIEP